jgi:asparagine synthase (glutamine-hydrolysing)
MIYLGLWSSQSASTEVSKLTSVIEKFTKSKVSYLKKQCLTIVYGKQCPKRDTDSIWDNDCSILIGRAFSKVKNTLLNSEEFNVLARELGQDLYKNIWGKYVYCHISGNALQLVVDLTGQLPCFFYTMPNGDLLFTSHIHLIAKYLSFNLKYNWAYFCSYLFYGSRSSTKTPFIGIEEVPPGCILYANRDNKKIQTFWNPFSTSKKGLVSQQNVVDVLKSSLKPVIEPYKNIYISLSGGLDSSALAYCLSEVLNIGQKVTAINYFNSAVESTNELTSARKVCKEIGIDLLEIDTSSNLPFDNFYHEHYGLKPNKPFPGCISLGNQEELQRYLPLDTEGILISGHGSDHIFMMPPTRKGIVDYFITEKGTSNIVGKIKDIAHFYRDSFTSVLAENLISLMFYFCGINPSKTKSKFLRGQSPCWLTRKLHHYKTYEFMHPVYQNLPTHILPGKYEQIDCLYDGLASTHGNLHTSFPEYYPFFSESVVNFALSLPTYDLFQNKYDRYPLRQAISSHFNTQTVWRRDKGETSGIIQLGIKKNLDYVLGLCLEGELVKNGFVDKKELLKIILQLSNGDINDLWYFIHLASIEMFLKGWNNS